MDEYEWSVIVWDSISLAFYSADLGTDIYTIVQYFKNRHYGWAGLTFWFTANPMIFSIFVFAWYINKTNLNVAAKSLITFLSVFVSSAIPFCWMALYIFGKHEYAYQGVGRLKLFEAFGESLPQAGLQMFVVFYNLRQGEPVEVYQWVTIAVSLGFLSFAVTTSYLFDNKSTITKVTFFIYFLLAVASRFMVCCMFLLIDISYWFMPLGTELGIMIVLTCCLWKCGGKDLVAKSLRYLVTFSSLINLCFAIGGIASLTTHLPIRIVALVLAVINFIGNTIYSCFTFANRDNSNTLEN